MFENFDNFRLLLPDLLLLFQRNVTSFRVQEMHCHEIVNRELVIINLSFIWNVIETCWSGCSVQFQVLEDDEQCNISLHKIWRYTCWMQNTNKNQNINLSSMTYEDKWLIFLLNCPALIDCWFFQLYLKIRFHAMLVGFIEWVTYIYLCSFNADLIVSTIIAPSLSALGMLKW